MFLRISIICLLLVSLCASAQNNSALQRLEQSRKVAHIRRGEAKLHLDGKLTEQVWEEIDPITDFTQTQPSEGAPVSERTEARIFYDEDNIYFGFKCYDSEPDKIVARLGPHDGRTNSDSVNILIDTFNDRRTGYFFSINSRGIQFDATTNEGSGREGWEIHDDTWDGIWQSAASLEPWGWSVEVVIPFKSIRLPRNAEQLWGLNLGRDIVRKDENAYWTAVTRFDATMKPSKAGAMQGLENVRVGHNLELIPFITGRYRRTDWQPELNGAKGNAGLDARYGLSSNITATLAVNPDFGETEADELTSEISRFEIFYPEKRKFFTEGANYFATPMELFFSRRIGARLPDGEPQRVLQGAKITGKTGPWTLGVLESVTQQSDYVDPLDGARETAPKAVFGVVRVQRDIFQKSAIGFISVNRLQDKGAYGQQETSHGVDLSILSGQHISWASQFTVNTNSANPGMDWQHTGWQSEFTYNSDLWTYEAAGKFLGSRVDMSNTGFEPETGRWSGDLRAVWKPFINRWGMRQFFMELNYDESNGTGGELQDAGADLRLRMQLQNFWNIHAEHSYDRVRFNEFTPDFQLKPAARIYETPKYRVWVESNENRRFWFLAKYVTGKLVQYGEHFYGSGKEVDLQASARINSHLRWDMTAINVRESLGDHTNYQDRRYLISRWNYQFSPKLRARVLAQYQADRYRKDFSLNSLVAYDFTARSAVFVGYNRQRHLPLENADLGHEVFVKLSYLWSF